MDRKKLKRKKLLIPAICIPKESPAGNPILLKEWFSTIDGLKKENEDAARITGKDLDTVINTKS